jgi:hypothetical protein
VITGRALAVIATWIALRGDLPLYGERDKLGEAAE